MAALFLCMHVVAYGNKHLSQSEFTLIRINSYYCPRQRNYANSYGESEIKPSCFCIKREYSFLLYSRRWYFPEFHRLTLLLLFYVQDYLCGENRGKRKAQKKTCQEIIRGYGRNYCNVFLVFAVVLFCVCW